MFVHIKNTYYFVKGKNPVEVFYDIFGRMNQKFISTTDKNKMIASIARQLKEKPVDIRDREE